jgi:transcriptional regulator with XRE-family HTH domain
MAKKSQNQVTIDGFGLAERVRYLRSRRDLSQEQLAKASGVSQSTIAQIERGRKDPSMTTLKKICKALDLELAVLFAGDQIHVFDMPRLSKRYKSAADLNPTLYKALGEVVRFARQIKFIE